MKLRYCRFQEDRALDLSEEMKTADIYEVDILSATQVFQHVWSDLPTRVVANCWKQTELLGATDATGFVGIEGSKLVYRSELQNLINQVIPRTTQNRVEDLSSPEDEKNCITEVNDESLVALVLDNVDDLYQIEPAAEKTDDALSLPSSKQQLAALALCKGMCDVYNAPDTIRRQLAAFQQTVRQERSHTTQQTALDQLLY